MKRISILIVMLFCFTLFLTEGAFAARYNNLSVGTLELQGNSSGTTQTLMKDSSGKILLQTGTTVPTDATTGYAKGGLFIDTDVATGTRALYENQGTSTSSLFGLVGAISSTDAVYGSDGNLQTRIARATYDFAVDGGTHNTAYDMGISMPDNAVITRAWYEVITTFQSGGSDAVKMSIGLPTDDANAIIAFTAISTTGDVWDAGDHEAIQTGTAANFSTKTTAARAATFSISSSAAGDLTAGALVLFLEYVISD